MENPHKAKSSEDYLERILMLERKLGQVRSIDIANDMSFSKPSVSIAMKKLKDSNYITIDDNGFISLTESGYQIASKVLEKHEIISKTLISLGVSEEIALEDACKIEHDLSNESFNAIKNHYLQNKK